ncbi:MAG: monofunctional biosynthetic peptidoglycan transglycosylase [Gammaproteobacteria bacterium]
MLAFVLASIMVVSALAWLAPPISSFMLRDYFSAEQETRLRYDWRPWESISPYMALAAIAAEDQRFPDHFGFDFTEIQRALDGAERGERLRGASTISQQVAKNLFLWPGRSLPRKALEVWFTMLIEGVWSKRRILEVYLNIAELGDGIYGVEAASQQFFHKPAKRLNLEEAALLAATLPNPHLYRAGKPSPHTRRRQAWILRQMRQLGGLSYLDNL